MTRLLRDDLKYIEKEANCHIAVHIVSAANKDMKQVLVLSNGTVVTIYTLVYFHVFKTTNVNKIWVKFGIHELQIHIPVYHLAEVVGTERLQALLKAHILIGCDVTSKTGSKSEACEAFPEKHLYKFGEDGR